MDNIVDYLVILFFIITFLASAFKKKKKNDAKLVEQQSRERVLDNLDSEQESRKSVKPREQKAINPLEEFFKFQTIIQPEPQKPKSEVDAYFEEALKRSAELEASKEKKELRSIKSDEINLEAHRKVREKSRSDFAKLNQMDIDKRTNKRAIEIKEKFKNSNTIRDFIIVQEILNKPKALRR
ncbi:MAG: hypothetical protein KAQ90_01830 [Melioribacteraceae bacterium]|nr:hypothetical protein [Melioribacteraceae bacterium]